MASKLSCCSEESCWIGSGLSRTGAGSIRNTFTEQDWARGRLFYEGKPSLLPLVFSRSIFLGKESGGHSLTQENDVKSNQRETHDRPSQMNESS